MVKFLNSEIAHMEEQERGVYEAEIQRLNLELQTTQELLAQYALQLMAEQRETLKWKKLAEMSDGGNHVG